jgi:membrane associated rhomboid family serine protease
MSRTDRSAPTGFPVVTAALAVACLAAYAMERLGDGLALCAAYGLVPTHPSARSALTAMFLHDPDPGNWVHVAGNLAALLVVGTIVERLIGSARFALLYLLAGLAGAGLHLVVAAGSADPMVGASGAIFGVMAAAAILRPRLAPFVVAFGAWTVWQLFAGEGRVALGAHVGGLAAGFVVVRLLFASKFEEVRYAS